MSTAFEVQVPQHMKALAGANEIRLERSALRWRVRSGEVLAAEVVVDPPLCAETLTVSRLLGMQRGWGERRVAKLLVEAGLSGSERLGVLKVRDARRLALLLPDGADAVAGSAVWQDGAFAGLLP